MRWGATRRGRGLVLLAALGATLVAAPAHAADPTKTELEIDVTVGPKNDTKCTIQANLFTPPGASKNDPVPAIMATNGFGGSKSDFDTLGPSYAKRGYAFLAYSGLGFGDSGCKITLDDPDWDGKAGSQLLTFLGGTKAANDGKRTDVVLKDASGDPRVGMIGGSYGGQIQFAIAGIDKRLDAIVPQITWNDLSYSLVPNNHDFERGVTYKTPGTNKVDWPVLFTALGLGQGFQQAVQNQDPSHLGACPNFADQVCPGLVVSASTGYADDATLQMLRHASVSSYMSKIRIPTLISQGQSDTLFNLQEAVATYKALRAQGTPVKMLWRSSGHSGGGISGESSSSNLESAYESRMALEWFDYYLRGIGDPPALDFSFLRDWVKYQGDAAPAVGVTPSYPAGKDQTAYLSGTDELVTERSGVQAANASFTAAPNASGSGGGAVANTPDADAPGTFASFATKPLTEDFELVGIPKLTVKLDAPTFAASQDGGPLGKLIVFAKLLDVGPDGTRVLPRSQLSAVRVADVTKPVEIELPGIAYRFPKGHTMRLVLGTSNTTNRGNTFSGPVAVVNDPAAPNTLTLPRLGAQSAATGAGPSGTTPFTPAPGAPPAQPASRRPRTLTAASFSTNKRCVKRRAVAFRIVQHGGSNRAASLTVTVNGKTKRKLRSPLPRKVRLTGMPKRGAYRVLVTVKTQGGKTLRSARTFRAC